MKIEVFNIHNIDRDKWNCIAIKESNICQTYEWALVSRKKPLFFVVIDKNDAWIAGWLIFESKLPFLKTISIFSEPIIMVEKEKDIIIDLLWDNIEKRKPIFVEWLDYANSKWGDKNFFINKKFDKIIEYGSYVLDLEKDNQVIWDAIDKKHRNVIRNAEKRGVIIKETTNIKKYYFLSQETYRRSMAAGPSFQAFKKVFDSLGSSNMCRIFFAEKDGKIMAAAFMLLCGEKVTYWHGATSDNSILGSSNLLHWHLIKKFKSKKFKFYDFGGASFEGEGKVKGINTFKKKFGGDLKIFYGGNKIYSSGGFKLFRILKEIKLKLKNILYAIKK